MKVIALVLMAIGLVGALPLDSKTSVRSAAIIEPAASYIKPIATDFVAPMASRSIQTVVQAPAVAAVQPVLAYKPQLTTFRSLNQWPAGYTNGAYYPGGWNYGGAYQSGWPYGQGYIGSQFANTQLLSQPSLVSTAVASSAPIATTEVVQPVVASRFYQPGVQTLAYESQMGYPALAAPKPLLASPAIVTRSWNNGFRNACLNGFC